MYKNLRKLILSFLLITSLFLSTGFGPALLPSLQSAQEVIRITQVDTSQFPQVTLYIAVVDQDGQPVGIDPGRIVIEENGVPIPLDQVQGIDEVGPLSTLLVMDVSGSMFAAGKLEAAKAAARAFVDQMRPNDLVGLISFSTKIEYVQPLTSNQSEMFNAIKRLDARGDTAMYDALAEGIEILENVEGRKAIIALTDGLDNRSVHTPEDVIFNIGPSGLSISTIGLGDPEHGAGAVTALDEDALIYLAENAGGLYGYANDKAGLSRLYQRYAIALQSEYVLTYTSPSTLRDGVNRALSVTLTDASGTAELDAEQAVYNPGGLVPEVAGAAPWPLFFTILAGMLLLLFVPLLINNVLALAPGKPGGGGGRKKLGKKRSRIKLKD